MRTGLARRGDQVRSFAEDLAVLLGPESARRLMTALAGREFYVPRQSRGAHPIAAAIGEEKAAIFCDHYYSMRVEFPVKKRSRTQILDLEAEGRTHGEIATLCGVSQRFVRKALGEHRLLKNQPSLFD